MQVRFLLLPKVLIKYYASTSRRLNNSLVHKEVRQNLFKQLKSNNMKTEPNAPAFPVTENNGLNGLTKREFFAIMILQGLFATKENNYAQDYAKASVFMADFLIKELNNTK